MGILVPGRPGPRRDRVWGVSGFTGGRGTPGRGRARPSRPVGADGEGFARSRRTRACCPSGPAANPSRGTNLNLSSPHHQCRTRLPTTPTGESPNNRQTATCWTSGWSSDGQRPRPRCPGMRSPPTLQAHKLNDGGQRPANGPGQTDRHHRSATDGQTASLHGMGSPSSRTGPKRDDGQHFRWSEPMWSPPPESNRRPHPYHEPPGTAVRNPVSPARARPSRRKLSVLFRRRYALSFEPCADRLGARISHTTDHEPGYCSPANLTSLILAAAALRYRAIR
jgi:hypothetical protein